MLLSLIDMDWSFANIAAFASNIGALIAVWQAFSAKSQIMKVKEAVQNVLERT